VAKTGDRTPNKIQRVYQKLHGNGPVRGGAKLEDLVGEQVAVDVAGWLQAEWIEIPLDDQILVVGALCATRQGARAEGPNKLFRACQTMPLHEERQHLGSEINKLQRLGRIVDALSLERKLREIRAILGNIAEAVHHVECLIHSRDPVGPKVAGELRVERVIHHSCVPSILVVDILGPVEKGSFGHVAQRVQMVGFLGSE